MTSVFRGISGRRGYYSAVSGSDRFRADALDAARWIDTIEPSAITTTLYAGTPGPVLFQLDERIVWQARRVVQAVRLARVQQARADPDAPCV
jgi:hypothetical protein